MTQEEILAQFGPREAMEYDVVVIGGGPGGLATAIRIKQLAAEKGNDVSVVVLEKGSEPGAHILSGAVMDPKAITELIPNWKELGAPLNQAVTGDDVTGDGVGDFIGFFDRIWRNGREILLEIPRASSLRIAQSRHDICERGNISLHWSSHK